MDAKRDKTGRPRRYSLQPPAGFSNIELAYAVAQLQEMAERVYDQIIDLPADALDFTTPQAPLSITMLVLHMAWAEAWWVRRISGAEIPGTIGDAIEKGSLARIGEPGPAGYEAASLIRICRQVQGDYSRPRLAPIRDIDEVMERDGITFSVRGVAGQLAWHWIYHSGQVGLLRLLWGSDYQWTSEDIVALRPR
jgi:hypothetical protein